MATSFMLPSSQTFNKEKLQQIPYFKICFYFAQETFRPGFLVSDTKEETSLWKQSAHSTLGQLLISEWMCDPKRHKQNLKMVIKTLDSSLNMQIAEQLSYFKICFDWNICRDQCGIFPAASNNNGNFSSFSFIQVYNTTGKLISYCTLLFYKFIKFSLMFKSRFHARKFNYLGVFTSDCRMYLSRMAKLHHRDKLRSSIIGGKFGVKLVLFLHNKESVYMVYHLMLASFLVIVVTRTIFSPPLVWRSWPQHKGL